MATHKNLGRDPFEETAYLELAKTYIQMGQLEDALAECKILAQHYKSLGMEKTAARVMALMARMRKAGPQKEITILIPPRKLKAPEAANKSFGLSKNDQKNGKDRREYYCFYLLCSVLLWILQNQFCFNS